MKMELHHEQWVFVGRVPMALACKSWRDRYKAVLAAEKSGWMVREDGSCFELEKTTAELEALLADAKAALHDALPIVDTHRAYALGEGDIVAMNIRKLLAKLEGRG